MKKRTFCMAVTVFFALTAILQAEPPKENRLPITISKETTYITEPLRPDGYPDYLAALNQMASEGVTPENNAAAALLQILGPERIMSILTNRKEREQFFKMLGIVPLPEKGGYFVPYEAFVKRRAPDALKDHDDTDEWRVPPASEEFELAGKRPWSEKECPLVAAWLAENEKQIQQLVEASKRPRYYLPVIADGDWMGSCYFHLLPMRPVVRALLRHSYMRLGEGKTQEAWDDMQACHRFARLQSQRSVGATDGLIAIMCEAMALHGDRQLAHYANFTPGQAEKFAAETKKLTPLPSFVEKYDVFERFLYLDSICATARGSVKQSDIIPRDISYGDGRIFIRGGDTPEWNALRDSLAKRIGGGEVNWDEALRLGNAHFERIAAVGRKSSFRERLQASCAINEKLTRQSVKYQWPRVRIAPALKNAVKRDASPPNDTEGIYVIFLQQLEIGEFGTIADMRIAIFAQVTRISLALSAYRANFGAYPDALEPLRPKYLARLPKDPFGDGDLCYRREADGYLLYSIGPDGKDDGGPRAYPGGNPVRTDSDDLGVQVGGADEEN